LLELSAVEEEKVLNNLDELDQLRQRLAQSVYDSSK